MTSKTAFTEMFYMTIKQTLFSRKYLFILLIAFLPVLLMAYALIRPDLNDPYLFFSDLNFFLYLQIISLLVCLLIGTSLISDELSNKTISYLTTRSLNRKSIIFAKYLGSVPVSYLAIALPVSIAYLLVGIRMGNMDSNIDLLRSHLVVLLMAIIIYMSFFNFLGVLLKHPLMIGLFFTFLWEVLLTNMPGSIPRITLMFYLRSLGANIIDLGFISTFAKISLSYSLAAIITLSMCFLVFSAYIFSKKNID